jgi:hypothetical protein
MPDNYWNYRVMRKVEEGFYLFGIYEVYYRCGKPTNWSKNPVEVSTDDPTEMESILNKMLRGATEFPILDYATGEEIDA